MLNILIHTDTRYPVNRKVIRRAISGTLKKYKVDNLDAEVSVSVVGARKMRELSTKYLGDTSKHQILTFPFEDLNQTRQGSDGASQGFVSSPDNVLRLGDVVLCWPQVLVEAAKDDIMVDDEVYDLIVHGVEHLLGYNHSE